MAEKMIYLGPGKPKLGLRYGTVYDGGLPPYVTMMMADFPELAMLIVDVEELKQKEARIKRQGTPEHRAYEVIEAVRSDK